MTLYSVSYFCGEEETPCALFSDTTPEDVIMTFCDNLFDVVVGCTCVRMTNLDTMLTQTVFPSILTTGAVNLDSLIPIVTTLLANTDSAAVLDVSSAKIGEISGNNLAASTTRASAEGRRVVASEPDFYCRFYAVPCDLDKTI